MNYLIGIDVGTSATKTVLFDHTGKIISSASEEYPLYQPHNGWAEQSPKDWKEAVLKTLSRVMAVSGVRPEDVKSIGISGQMHGSLFARPSSGATRGQAKRWRICFR